MIMLTVLIISFIFLIVVPVMSFFIVNPTSRENKKRQINRALDIVFDYYFYGVELVSDREAHRHARFDLLDIVCEDETNIDKLYKEYAVPILELYDFSYTFKTVAARNKFRVARMKPMYDELIQKINEMYEIACVHDEELLSKCTG